MKKKSEGKKECCKVKRKDMLEHANRPGFTGFAFATAACKCGKKIYIEGSRADEGKWAYITEVWKGENKIEG